MKPYCTSICTFNNNSATTSGGGVFNNISTPILTNCILWGNTDSGGSDTSAQIHSGTPVVTYSCIQDDDPDDASIPFGGATNNNIYDNPLFVNTASGNVKLSYNSPCIETANNGAIPTDTTDIDGDSVTVEIIPWDLDAFSRFTDGNCDGTATVDMGAYEFTWVYIGDLDGDCDVDFAITANHWLAGVE